MCHSEKLSESCTFRDSMALVVMTIRKQSVSDNACNLLTDTSVTSASDRSTINISSSLSWRKTCISHLLMKACLPRPTPESVCGSPLLNVQMRQKKVVRFLNIPVPESETLTSYCLICQLTSACWLPLLEIEGTGLPKSTTLHFSLYIRSYKLSLSTKQELMPLGMLIYYN